MLAELVSSEASVFGLQMVAFLLPHHLVFPLCTYIPGVSPCVLLSSSYKDISQIGIGLILTASFLLITSLKALSQIQPHSEEMGVRASTYEFGGDTV